MRLSLKVLLLKFLALVTLLSLYFPVILAVRYYFFKQPQPTFNSFYEVLWIFTGLAAALVIRRIAKNPELALIITYFLPVLPLVLTPLILNESVSTDIFFTTLISTVFFIVGLRSAYRHYKEIIGHVIITGGVISVCLVSLIMASLAEVPSYKDDAVYFNNFMAFAMYPFIILFSILRNNITLEQALQDENNGSAISLKRIHTYNIVLLVSLFALSILVLNIKSVVKSIGALINSIVFRLMHLAGMVINSVLGFLARFFGDKHFKDTGSKAAGKAVVKGTRAVLETPGYMKLVVLIFGMVLLVFLLIKLSRLLFKALKAIRKLASHIAALVGINESSRLMKQHEDTIEGIGTDYLKKRKLAVRTLSLEKALAKARCNAEKVRCMYGIILIRLKLSKLELNEADTTGGILQKAKSAFKNQGNFKDVTNMYDLVRYRDYEPESKELKAVSLAFNSILKDIGAFRKQESR